MKTAEEIIKDLQNAYTWNTETAASLARDHRLNNSELQAIADRLIKARLLAQILAVSAPEQWAHLPAECEKTAAHIQQLAEDHAEQ